ncbi:MAG: hypothetical protein MAG451_02983 [Anaerolineales bacterium]|nr:hypothetical protein [Anaerolineales bacterium]
MSHKIPIIRYYVQDMSFSEISQALDDHGLQSKETSPPLPRSFTLPLNFHPY